MDSLQVIAPLIGVVLGGALSGLGTQLNIRRERKRILAIALADLLEIRHRMNSFEHVIQQLRIEFGINQEAIPIFRNLFDTLVISDPKLDERYDEAVSLVSGINPLLGFRLRSKNEFPKLLSTLRISATSEGSGLDSYETFESMLRIAALPSFDSAIVSLAWNHSIVTWLKVKRLIKNSKTVSPEAVQVFKQLKAHLPQQTVQSSQQA